MVRRFGRVEALSGLTFTVAPGELFGLVGPDGAGKTTAIRALAGLLALDGGAAAVLGRKPAQAREFVEKAKNRELDHLLLLPPGRLRGEP